MMSESNGYECYDFFYGILLLSHEDRFASLHFGCPHSTISVDSLPKDLHTNGIYLINAKNETQQLKGIFRFYETKITHLSSFNGDDFVAVDLDKDVEAVNSSVEEKTGVLEGGGVIEPYVGMEFESEDAARNFYTEYARRVGFVVRIMQRRRSGVDGRTLARRLGCNKQGFSPNHRGAVGPEKKPRPSAREGCKATILVKMEKSGKWVVTRFEKDHNHPLVVTASGFSTSGDKDKKIEELTGELEHQEQLCAAYRERLLRFMSNAEEQTEELASKIEIIIGNVRKVESETQKSSWHR